MEEVHTIQQTLSVLRSIISESKHPEILRHFLKGYVQDESRIPRGWALRTIDELCAMSSDEILESGRGGVEFIEVFSNELLERLCQPASDESPKVAVVGSSFSETIRRWKDLVSQVTQLRRQDHSVAIWEIWSLKFAELGLRSVDSKVSQISVDQFLSLNEKSLMVLFDRGIADLQKCIETVEHCVREHAEPIQGVSDQSVPSDRGIAHDGSEIQRIEVLQGPIEFDSGGDVYAGLPWEVALRRIEKHGLGDEMLCRLAPRLRDLPYQLWRRRFADYFGLCGAAIDELEGHGRSAVQSLLHVFTIVGNFLPEEPVDKHFEFALNPYDISRCQSRLIALLATAVDKVNSAVIDDLIQPLFDQIELDLDYRCAEVASRFCGFTARSRLIKPTTFLDVGGATDLSIEGVRKVMTRVEEVLLIRWPNGPVFLECLAARLASAGRFDVSDSVYEVRARLFGVNDRLAVPQERDLNGVQKARMMPSTSNACHQQEESTSQRSRGLTLTQHVRNVLMGCSSGLKLKEIAARVLRNGYITESRQFENVVYQVLHRDPQIVLDKRRKCYALGNHAAEDRKLFECGEVESQERDQSILVNNVLLRFLESDQTE